MGYIPDHHMKGRFNAVLGRRGSSPLEVLIATLVMFIATLGILNVRYDSTIDTRRAEVGATACRVVLLTEAWIGGKTLDLKNSAKVYYNASLRNESFSESDLPIKHWKEI